MQTLNILENTTPSFNVYNVLANTDANIHKHNTSLLEQLQTTLSLDKLLDIFAMEAARYIKFSGLYFKNNHVSKTLRGSRKTKYERQFELKLNNSFLGTITYGITNPVSLSHMKDIQRIHQILLYPLNNALQYHQAMQLAMQDGLTQLGNRRYFDEQLKRAMHNANRHHAKLGLILCDLNKFKTINDTHGHSVGDQVLVQFANILRTCVRDSDSIFRFGGDEFAIIVENVSDDALNIIDGRVISALKTDVLMSKYQVSCSLGCTFMNRVDNEQTLFERTDQALYHQKLKSSKHLTVV